MPLPVPVESSSDGAGDRMFCGLRVSAAFPLPDLPAWVGDGRPVDLAVTLGAVPRLADPVVNRPFLQVAANGTCRFEIPGVAAWRVAPDGGEVTVDPVGDPAAAEQRTFLYGTVFAIVGLRKGLLPLHAASLRFAGGAAAFAGTSGIGKSTLAASLVRRGLPILADDVTMVDMSAPGGPLVLPAFPRVKLWRDAADRFGLPVEGLERARPELDKYHFPVPDHFCPDPVPLRILVLLEGSRASQPGLRRLGPMEVLTRSAELLYRPLLMSHLGLHVQQMEAIPRLLAAIGGAHALRRITDDAELDALVTELGG